MPALWQYSDVSGNLTKPNKQTDNYMEQIWRDRWNERYSEEEFAYGEQPNNYLQYLRQILIEKKRLYKILFFKFIKIQNKYQYEA